MKFKNISVISHKKHEEGKVLYQSNGVSGAKCCWSLKPYEDCEMRVIVDNEVLENISGKFFVIEFFLYNSYGDIYIEEIKLLCIDFPSKRFCTFNGGVKKLEKTHSVPYIKK